MFVGFILFLCATLYAHPYEITLIDIADNSRILYNPALKNIEYGLSLSGIYFKTKDWYGQQQSYVRLRNVGFLFNERKLIPNLLFSVVWNNFIWEYETEFGQGGKEKNLVILNQSYNTKKLNFGINENIYSFSMYQASTEISPLKGVGVDIGIKYYLTRYFYLAVGINDIGYTKIKNEYEIFFYIKPKHIFGIEILTDSFNLLHILYTDFNATHSFNKLNCYLFNFLALKCGIYSFDFFDKNTIAYFAGLDFRFSLFYLSYEFHYFDYTDIKDSQFINQFSIKINIR